MAFKCFVYLGVCFENNFIFFDFKFTVNYVQ